MLQHAQGDDLDEYQRAGESVSYAPAGLRPYRPTRAANPIAFHFFLTLYLCGGLALLVWGVLALAGLAEPMPID